MAWTKNFPKLAGVGIFPFPSGNRGLPYVKVRLGRLIRGEQKGVDALIYRDLMTLARERAITCAYLLSGEQTAGRAFAISWAKNASTENLKDLLAVQPRIPAELDVSLLVEAEKSVGPLIERQDLKRELRAAFWAEIRVAHDVPVPS